MKKIKVMHFVAGLTSGGVEQMLCNYCGAMNKDAYEFVLAYQHQAVETCKEKIEESGCRTIRITARSENFIKNLIDGYRVIKKERPDIVHAHMNLVNFCALLPAYLLGVKVRISHSHIAETNRNILFRIMAAICKFLCVHAATDLMTCGQEAGIYLYGKRRMQKGKVLLVENAINLDYYDIDPEVREKIREQHKLQDQLIIGHVGRFSYQKNHEKLIHIFSEISKRRADAVLLLVGTGELEEQIKELVQSLNIQDDKMLFYNIDEVTYILYSMMSKNNPDLICERFEEGILSYNNSFPSSDKMKIARLLRKLLHKRNLLEQILHFYCFTPAVYEGKLGTLIIPPIESINDSSVTQFLSLFAVNNVSSCYKQKYIYFSSVYDFEGGEPIGELDLVKKIAEKVKNENLIVKVHPRDNPQRFIECGLNVDLNSQIPWEVVQFKQDFSQHIFLTVNSGSVLGVNMIISDMPRTYFLFPLCDLDKNPKAQVSAKNIDKLMKFINQIPEKRDRIKIASDLSEIL